MKREPYRPQQPPAPTSWWTEPRVQHDRAAFEAEAAKQEPRINAITVSWNKPTGPEPIIRRRKESHDEA